MESERLKIGEVARLARVTVRTLHHYDEIGLLQPAYRSQGEYREYSRGDVERLHVIRLYAALGVPLDEIRQLLDEPGFDPQDALRSRREELAAHVAVSRAQLDTIDRILSGAEPLSPEDLFDGFEREAWSREAEARWGDSDAWRESQRRLGGYDDAKMARIRAEHEGILQEFGRALREGVEPTTSRAMDLAEAARRHVDRWFYPLSKDGHARLAQLYTTDARFRATYERVAKGLSAYVSRAIEANAAR